MCQAGICFSIGFFFNSLVLMAVLFGLWTPVYEMNGNSSVSTEMRYDLWDVCFYSKGEKLCVKFDDPLLVGINGANSFEQRQVVFMAFLFTTVGLSGVITLLSFLACCKVISFDECWAWAILILFALLAVVSAIVTPAVPSSELGDEEGKFNDLSSRNESFYNDALKALARSNSTFTITARKAIEDDLKSDELQMKIGWVLCVLWIGPCCAVAAFLFFLMGKCCSCCKKDSQGSRSEKKSLNEQNRTGSS